MQAHDDTVRVPRVALIAAACVITFTIAVAGIARVTGIGRSTMPEAQRVEQRALLFEDRADGSIVVRDADGNGIVDVLAPGTYGFVRVAMRGMARDRKIHGVGPTPPFMLTRWSDARVTLDDPNTGRRLDLGAFGRPNAEAFERLLVRGEPKP